MDIETLLASSDWITAGGLLLVLIGLSFLVMEFFLPTFGLFGFAGASSILIGVVQLHQAGHIDQIPVSADVLIFLAVLGLVFSVISAYYTWRLYRKRVTTGVEAMIGQKALIVDWRGDKGHIFIEGENWQAYSETKLSLKKDDVVLVALVDGLKIKITQPH